VELQNSDSTADNASNHALDLEFFDRVLRLTRHD